MLANGGLNVSELDGWWAEAYTEKVGWALGDRHEHGDDPAWDAAEAGAEAVSTSGTGSDSHHSTRVTRRGFQTGWVARIRADMATLAPQFFHSRPIGPSVNTLKSIIFQRSRPMRNGFQTTPHQVSLSQNGGKGWNGIGGTCDLETCRSTPMAKAMTFKLRYFWISSLRKPCRSNFTRQ